MGPFVGCPDRKSTKYCVRTKGKDRCPFKGCSGKYRRRAPVSCLTLHRLQIYVWLAATKSVSGTRCSPCKLSHPSTQMSFRIVIRRASGIALGSRTYGLPTNQDEGDDRIGGPRLRPTLSVGRDGEPRGFPRQKAGSSLLLPQRQHPRMYQRRLCFQG